MNLNNMNTINILCATDDKYACYCGIMLTSLFKNNTHRKFSIFLMTDVLSEYNSALFYKLCNVYHANLEIIKVVNYVDITNFPIRKGDHVSLAAYYRLLAPLFLPKSIEKILYLDCDIIVNGFIDDLWNIDIVGNAIAAVIDENYKDERIYNRLNYKYEKMYFNTGVLLINLIHWRKHAIMNKCIHYINNNPHKILFHDQDTLNVVLQDEKILLSPKFNLQTGFLYKASKLGDIKDDVEANKLSPIIIHYTGPSKPWHEFSQHPYVNHFIYFWKCSLWDQQKLIISSLKGALHYYRNCFIWFLGIKKRPETYTINKQVYKNKLGS